MSTPPRRWFAFRLRTLFVVAAVVLAVLLAPAYHAEVKRRQLVKEREGEAAEITRMMIERRIRTWGPKRFKQDGSPQSGSTPASLP